jgi:lysophospholipase L1-like esterase
LFAAGEQGGLYDPSDNATLSQLSSGSGAVTATSDPVGKMLDKSGRGNHLLQVTSGARGTYKASGGLASVVFDGVAQFLTASNVNFAGATKATFVLALRQLVAGTSGSVLMEMGNPSTSAGFGAYLNNGSPSGAFGGGIGLNGPNNLFNNTATGGAAPRTYVASIVYDPSAASDPERVRLRIDGGDTTEFKAGGSGTVTTSAFALKNLSLGSRDAGSAFANFEFYGGLLIARELSAGELYQAEQWCAARSGVVLNPYSYGVTEFTETGAALNKTTHLLTSEFAQSVFTTQATSLDVETYNNYFAEYPQFTGVGVLVGGAYNQTISPGALGYVKQTIALPAGNKTVTLLNGTQTRVTTVQDPKGTFFTRVWANAPMTQANPVAANRVLVYGDSITGGANATPITQNAWAMIVRRAYAPNSLALEGWGVRSLNEDCTDATARAAFVAKLVAYTPQRLWLAIGTNDYGLSKWTAASFGAAYAALLDDLHAALPGLPIYCQTPLLRGTETANASGSTLGDYRAQIATVVSTRTSYCALIDGTTILTLGDLDPDNLHPTTAGQAQYAAYVRTALGI